MSNYTGTSGLGITRVLRPVGLFAGNLATATITPAILDTGLVDFIGRPLKTAVRIEDALSAALAFGLGYFVYRRWKFVSAKWVWVAGVSFFLAGLLANKMNLSELCWEFIPSNCEFDLYSFENWVHTLVLVRTLFYSVGALAGSYSKPAT